MHGFCNSCESFYTYVISTTTKYSSSRFLTKSKVSLGIKLGRESLWSIKLIQTVPSLDVIQKYLSLRQKVPREESCTLQPCHGCVVAQFWVARLTQVLLTKLKMEKNPKQLKKHLEKEILPGLRQLKYWNRLHYQLYSL